MSFDYKPKLTEKKFDDHVETYNELIEERKKGVISQEEYISKRDELIAELEMGMDPLDRRIFERSEDLEALLLKIMPRKVVEENIRFKREHGERAKSLGYLVQYGVYLMEGYLGKLVVAPFCLVEGETTSDDLEEIENAPENPRIHYKN